MSVPVKPLVEITKLRHYGQNGFYGQSQDMSMVWECPHCDIGY